MLSDKDKANIEEMLYAIKHIHDYMENILSLEELLDATLVYDAVMMNFILIGEAGKRLDDGLKNRNQQIDWKRMKNYRNYIAHEYFGLDEKIVWSAIKIELPKLKDELEKILKETA